MHNQSHHDPEAFIAAAMPAEPEHKVPQQKKMSRHRQYSEFLAIIKAGHTPLEAARKLGIRTMVLKRYIAEAIMQKDLQQTDFSYETVLAKDLPRSFALMLKATDADIIKGTLLEDGSVKINIL